MHSTHLQYYWSVRSVIQLINLVFELLLLSVFLCAAAGESLKDTSEPTGSPAPVIQHSSLASSPSTGHNGLSSRAAAEAMAMSVLAGMGQQQRAESGASHIIVAAHSHSAARWWAASPAGPRLGSSSRGRKDSPPSTTIKSRFHASSLILLTCSESSCGAMTLWPGAQQQPSGNGLRLLKELPVHYATNYRGWTPVSPSLLVFLLIPSQSVWFLTRLMDRIK